MLTKTHGMETVSARSPSEVPMATSWQREVRPPPHGSGSTWSLATMTATAPACCAWSTLDAK